MFPVPLDCPMFCLTSVSCFPDVSNVSRLSNVLFSLCLVFRMFPVSLYCLLCFVCLTSVSCVPDVSSVSRLSNVLSSFCVLCS